MFGKLLKYELKSTYKVFLSAFAAYIVFTSVAWLALKGHGQAISMTIMMCGLTALFVMTFVLLFQRYNSNLYGAEGYLMFTAPASSRILLMSKLVSAIIWIAALEVVCLYTFVYFTFMLHMIKLPEFLSWIGMHGLSLTSVIVSTFLTVTVSVLAIYFSITVSKLALWRRFGTLMGFVTFFVLSYITTLPYDIYVKVALNSSVAVNSLFYPYMFMVVAGRQSTINMQVYCIQNITSAVASVALFFATAWLMEKHTSLR